MLERNVAEGVHRIGEAFVNWYLVEEDGRLTVVDAGLPSSWHSLHSALNELGRSPDDIEALVLTHAHFDHIGFAERARSELGIPVWVHDNDVPLTRHPWSYLRDRSPLRYLTRPGLREATVAFLRAGVVKLRPIREVRRYSSDGELEVPGRPRVVFTPGHTLGHCALHLEARDTLIAGDALVTKDPYTGLEGPRLVARAATADPDRALGSLEPLEATGARTVLPGHGEPWREGVEAAVAEARRNGFA